MHSASPKSQRREWLYVGMGCVALLVVVAGFGRPLAGAITGDAPLPPLVAIHAALSVAWLVLFVAQAALVRSGRVGAHRRLGAAGAALAVGLVGVGYATAVAAARRGFDLPLDDEGHDPLRFLVFTLGDLLNFAALVAAGVALRGRPGVHKRLMLLATVGPMMGAPLAHFFAHAHALPVRTPFFVASLAALLLAPAVYDRVTRGRFHPVTLWGGVGLFVWGNVRALVIGPSAGWHAVAGWIIE